MLPSVLTTVLFSLSTIFAGRSTRLLGGAAANFWRLIMGTTLLGILAHLTGVGLRGAALPVFLLSGLIGFGLGDSAYFHALPRLGPRLSILMVQCLAAPIAAVVEWVWLDTTPTGRQIAFGAVALGGVALAMAPQKRMDGGRLVHGAASGIFFGLIAAAGQGIGAVLSRKGYHIAVKAGESIDSISAAYQRILGGVAVAGGLVAWEWIKARRHPVAGGRPPAGLRQAWGWVAANALTGSVLGVSCYQWALKSSSAAVVLPIVATAPIVIIPFSYFIDGEKPSKRSLIGGTIAVGGVVGLTWAS